MKRVSIGMKIALGFVLALLGILTIGFVSASGIRSVVDVSARLDRSHEAMMGVDSVLIDAINCETGVRGYVLTGQDSYLEPYRSGIADLPGRMDALGPLMNGDAAQQRRFAQLQQMLTGIEQNWTKSIEIRRSQGFKPAAQFIDSDTNKMLMDQIRAQIGDIQSADQTLRGAARTMQEEIASSVQGMVIVGSLLILLVVAGSAVLITRSIAVPLRAVTTAAGEIARGNFNVELTMAPRRDEIGELQDSFQRMNESLRDLAGQAERIAAGDLTGDYVPRGADDLLGQSFAAMRGKLIRMTAQLGESSSVLAASMQQILAAVAEVNAGVTETAASVTQTTATVEEVRQTASLSSQKARAVSDVAQKSVEVSSQGKHSVQEMIAGMERIRQQMDAIAESIVRLNEHGQAIGEIIAVVNDLSEQSNLLAVNAAIEAVRAGEHGKSFAVVAQEVRSLADQSRQATAQVRGILNDVQKATSAVVMTTEQGRRVTEAGLQQATRAGEAMRQMDNTIAEASRAAIQIAASSQQQLVGMDQIAEAIENIKQASVQNVTSVQQVQSAAHHLQPVGKEMDALIRQYHTAAAGV